MTNIFRIIIVILIIMTVGVSALPSYAGELEGVALPDQIQVNGNTLVLNGLGLRLATAFKVKVYVAGLYLADRSDNPEVILGPKTPKRLVLHFLRSVGSSKLRKAWEKGFEKNAGEEISALRDRIDKLKDLTKKNKKGQELTFTYDPGKGIRVDIDGTVVGTIEGDDFARAFLSIWLGPEPPNPKLKEGLLGIID